VVTRWVVSSSVANVDSAPAAVSQAPAFADVTLVRFPAYSAKLDAAGPCQPPPDCSATCDAARSDLT
jgi:hypothetical protein